MVHELFLDPEGTLSPTDNPNDCVLGVTPSSEVVLRAARRQESSSRLCGREGNGAPRAVLRLARGGGEAQRAAES